MDKKEAQRQLDVLNSDGAKPWREKFPERFKADVERLENCLGKSKKEEKVEEKVEEVKEEKPKKKGRPKKEE